VGATLNFFTFSKNQQINGLKKKKKKKMKEKMVFLF
jgi:hypothetical protein